MNQWFLLANAALTGQEHVNQGHENAPVQLPIGGVNDSDEQNDEEDSDHQDEEVEVQVAVISIGKTRESVTAYLKHHGAVPDFTGVYGNLFSTKQVIKFTCACGKPYAKMLKNFGSMGPLCKECRHRKNRDRFTEMARALAEQRKRPKQVVHDETKERFCNLCEWVRPIEHFVNSRYPDSDFTSLCFDCREKGKVRNKKTKNKKKLAVVSNEMIETHKKCNACFIIRELKFFRNGNKNCDVCNDQGVVSYEREIEDAKEINSKDGDEKKCIQCWNIMGVDEFMTEAGNSGVVCCSCRHKLRTYAVIVEQEYVSLKVKMSPCVDCGETDIRIMDFDHIDRESKSLGVSECQSIDQLRSEVKKCVLRCGICHVKRTAKQMNYGFFDFNKRSKLHSKMQRISQERKVYTGCQSGNCKWADKWKDFPHALHFDHIDPSTKTFNVSEFWKFKSIEEQEAEMAKCQVMCVHCHRLRTFEQFKVKLYDDWLSENKN